MSIVTYLLNHINKEETKKNIVYLIAALLLVAGKASFASNLVAIESAHSVKFVTTGIGQGILLAAVSDHIRAYEKFRIIPAD